MRLLALMFLCFCLASCRSVSEDTPVQNTQPLPRISVILGRALDEIQKEKGLLPAQSSIQISLNTPCFPSQIAQQCTLIEVRRSLHPRSSEEELFAQVLIDQDTQQVYESR